jgi:hypothetical protein
MGEDGADAEHRNDGLIAAARSSSTVGALAAHRVRRLEAHSAAAVDQQIKATGWLTASLLAVNGAGVLAIMSAADRIMHPVIAASCFLAGICSTIANAYFIQNGQIATMEPLENFIRYWREVEQGGERQPEIEARLTLEYEESMGRYSWAAPLCGWISFGAFLGGAAAVAATIQLPTTRVERQCVELQRDMLTATPSRHDARELFQALGCRAR